MLQPAMAAPISFSILPHSVIHLCAVFLILCLSSSASQEPINVSSICPHILTTSSIQNRPSSNDTFLAVVPWKVGYEQFVQFNPDSCLIGGFSVEVFLHAVRRLHHVFPRHWRFVLHGNGTGTPSYDDMINMVARGEVDAVVADLTITRQRMESVAFSMPYLPSTLVMVTPFRYGSAGTLWDFLKPFSKPLWVTLLVCFVATGAALYLLENKNPDFSATLKTQPHEPNSQGASAPGRTASAPAHDASTPELSPSIDITYPDPSSFQRPGPPIYDQASHKRRIMNAYWFTSLCVFAAQQESVRTHLGRFVTVMWLFVMLIFNSSYTASLASLLSAQKRYPTIERFETLVKNKNISVGYQEGSFVQNYTKMLHIDQHRLRNFTSERGYAEALKEGNLKPDGVGAVLDELPYIQILLQSECFLTRSSDDDNLPSFGGFGFAFRKNSPLIDEVSKMIVAMEEDGTLKKLQNGWGIGAKRDRCSSSEESSHMRLRSFGGLFSIVCGVYAFCLLWHLSVKAIQSRKGCSHITNALACVRGRGNICGREGASLSWRSSKVSDVSLEITSLHRQG